MAIETPIWPTECEYKIGGYHKWLTASCNGEHFVPQSHMKYCPFCGRSIKRPVFPDQIPPKPRVA